MCIVFCANETGCSLIMQSFIRNQRRSTAASDYNHEPGMAQAAASATCSKEDGRGGSRSSSRGSSRTEMPESTGKTKYVSNVSRDRTESDAREQA